MLYYVVLLKCTDAKSILYFTSEIELILDGNYVYILYACISCWRDVCALYYACGTCPICLHLCDPCGFDT